MCWKQRCFHALPHVKTRRDHGDAKPRGSGHELWGDPWVQKLLVPCNKKGSKMNHGLNYLLAMKVTAP